MKNGKMLRTLLVTAGLMAALGLTACGKEEGASTDTAAATTTVTTEKKVTGKTESYGNFSEVLIPEGMVLKAGKLDDHDDPNVFWIQRSDNEAHYYMVRIEDEATCISSVTQTKDANKGAQDVNFTAGEMNWSGAAYKYNDVMDSFQIYGKQGERFILVSAGWHSVDEDVTKAILGSIKIK